MFGVWKWSAKMWRMKLLGPIVQFTFKGAASTENIWSCLQCLWRHLVILKDEISSRRSSVSAAVFEVGWFLCSSWSRRRGRFQRTWPLKLQSEFQRMFVYPPLRTSFSCSSHGSLTGKLGELCLRSSFRMLHLHLFSCLQNLKRLFKMNFWNQIKMLGWRWWDLSWAQEVSNAWTIKCTSVGWHRQLRASLHGWLFTFCEFWYFDVWPADKVRRQIQLFLISAPLEENQQVSEKREASGPLN